MSYEGKQRLINATKVQGTPWSLSRSVRFPSSASKHTAEAICMPSTFARKSITMGLGGRWEPKILNESPPPNFYNLSSSFNSPIGPILTNKPRRKDDNGIPGPGSYNISQTTGQNSPKFSLQSKYKELIPKKSPSPIAYSLNTSQVFHDRFKEIGFGFGDRDFLKNLEKNSPGPNEYIIPSRFDRFKAKRYSPILDIFQMDI